MRVNRFFSRLTFPILFSAFKVCKTRDIDHLKVATIAVVVYLSVGFFVLFSVLTRMAVCQEHYEAV